MDLGRGNMAKSKLTRLLLLLVRTGRRSGLQAQTSRLTWSHLSAVSRYGRAPFLNWAGKAIRVCSRLKIPTFDFAEFSDSQLRNQLSNLFPGPRTLSPLFLCWSPDPRTQNRR